jgi:hypothetical protein
MSTRPLYVLTFRAEPNVDGLRAIRALLKSAWRVHRLRCVEIRELPNATPPASAATSA